MLWPYLIGFAAACFLVGSIAHLVCDREEIADLQRKATDEHKGFANSWELL